MKNDDYFKKFEPKVEKASDTAFKKQEAESEKFESSVEKAFEKSSTKAGNGFNVRIMSANAGRQLKELYGVSLEFLSSSEATNTNKA